MKVSVCIPTFNQASYVEQAIRSAADQSFQAFEIIVYDDNSTDNTKEVLQKLSAKIPLLKIIHQAENLGIAKNTDACLRSANGDFVVRLDSDDYLAPGYIQNLLELLLKYPAAGYAHAVVQEVNENGNFLHKRKLFRKTGFQSSDDALKAAVKGYRVAANILMFRREALEKVNYLSGRPNFGEDYHLTASISAAGFGNVYSDEVLSYYRVWVDAGRVRQKRKITEIDGLRRVFEEVIEPAYRKRGWNLQEVRNSKTSFACVHADCLSWGIYSSKEKEELFIELQKISSAPKLKLIALAYLNGFGKFISFPAKLNFFFKRLVKGLITH